MLTRRLTSAGEVAVYPYVSEHVASLARLRQGEGGRRERDNHGEHQRAKQQRPEP